MARFSSEIPYDVIKQLEELSEGNMTDEMLQEAGKVVEDKARSRMHKVFDTTKSLDKGLKLTKIYRTSDGSVNVHLGFYGYADSDKPVTVQKRRGNKVYRYKREGVPIGLIAIAREYGTSKGEGKQPFFRQSFNKGEIESVMRKVQDKYIKEDNK